MDKEDDSKQFAPFEYERTRLETLGAYSVKAELYVVSLTFSVLALAVQFPISEGNSSLPERLQALGWILLVLSGLAGVKVLRNASRQYELALVKLRFLEETERKRTEGDKKARARVKYFENRIVDVQRQDGWLLPVQGYTLFFGFVCLVAARILTLESFR